MVETEHPSLGGAYWRYGPAISFSGTPGRALPYCEKGEHTREILARLGYGPEEIDGFKAAGIVTWPSGDTEGAAVAG
jgi:crotonobetainyl-CoA:carnitine CoA-transferase CaiB-like acyl-CoA transferase